MGGASGAHAGCQVLLNALSLMTGDSLDDFVQHTLADAGVLLTLSEIM